MRRLFSELKRRNIIRVAVAYTVAAWILLQAADLVLENISAPLWIIQVFMLFLALGFPLVLVFSWAFEITPEGIRRDKDVDRSTSITQRTGQRLDRLTIVLVGFVLIIFATERLVLTVKPGAASDLVGDKSIAVLAFQDLSPAGDQEYFAEGISEELLNVLAQIQGLEVAGRTSSFAFKGQQRDLRDIGESLNVAHILEGSVRTSGNRVRVTAQLIKANDGFHLFSKNYDRELTDIFDVQDDIAHEISVALRSAIMGEKTIENATPTDLASYDKYLRARQWIHTRDRILMEEASDLLDEALTIAPDYGPALAQKALVILLLSDDSYGEIPQKVALQMSRPLLDRALEIDPDLAEAHAVLGLWHYDRAPGRNVEAIASFKRALAINPSLANANNWLGMALVSPDDTRETERLYEFILKHDPLYRPAFSNLTLSYLSHRQLDKAEALIRRVERIEGGSSDVLFSRGLLLLNQGELADAVSKLQQAYKFKTGYVSQQMYRIATFLVGDLERSIEVSVPTDRLLPLEMAGRGDEAEALFESLGRSFLTIWDRRSIGEWMLFRERPEDLIAFLEEVDGDGWLDKQRQIHNLWGAQHQTNTAYALLLSGRDADASEMLSRIRGQLDAQSRNGADNVWYWLTEAEYAAMAKEPVAMLESLRKAVDSGFICVFGFWPVQFDRYRTDPGFIDLENEMIRRANAERQKLGMSVLPPFLPTT